MCGGIVGALSFGGQQRSPTWTYILLFNTGRICSYMLIGAIVGGVGNALGLLPQLHLIQIVLYLFANLILIGLGLYVAGISSLITRIETIGTPVWRRLQPITRKLLPIQHWPQALAMGALWGWVPCGLVYTALLGALASATPQHGAALMLAFGLGTLPNLLLIAAASKSVSRWLAHPLWKRCAGALILAFGLTGLLRGLLALGNS